MTDWISPAATQTADYRNTPCFAHLAQTDRILTVVINSNISSITDRYKRSLQGRIDHDLDYQQRNLTYAVLLPS